MATQSDFAQKLLHDLRVRKERMAAAQSTSLQSAQTCRTTHGNTRHHSPGGSRHTNILDDAASTRAGNSSRRSNHDARMSTITNENRIVLYKTGQKASRQQSGRDLSMAIARAFQHGGNPIVKFFNRLGCKSSGRHALDITAFGNNRSRFPTMSNVHVSEVSRGVRRLNQILRACSAAFGLEGIGFIEIGKELLKGAMDLEESLRTLEASQCVNSTRNKGRFQLLDEDDDDTEIVKKWESNRPNFSFDRPRRQKLDLSGFNPFIGASEQPIRDLNVVHHRLTKEKKRISNVIAKLMGLNEVPKKTITESVEHLSRESHDRRQKVHSIATIRVDRYHQFFGDNRTKQNPGVQKQSGTIGSESKMQILDATPPKKRQQGEKAMRKTNNTVEYNLGTTSTETRKANTTTAATATKDRRLQEKSMTTSKSKKSTATKNLLQPKSTTKNRANNPPKTPDQDYIHTTDISQQPERNKEIIKKDDELHKSSTREPEIIKKRDKIHKNRNSTPMKSKPIKASTKHTTVIPKNLEKCEIPKLLKNSKQHPNGEIKNKSPSSASGIANTEGDKLKNKNEVSMLLSVSVKDERLIDNAQNARAHDEKDSIAINAEKVSDDHRTVEEPCASKDEQDLMQCDHNTVDCEAESIGLCNHPQDEHKQIPVPERREHPLTEPEKKLKETAIKSQMFLSTAEALFKLNLPASFLHAAEQDYEPAEDKLVLNCAQEVMKRKARRHEAANQSHTKTALACPTVRSLDDLIKQMSKDMETLKFHGGNLGEERDLAARLYRMVEKDISDNKVADVNCMWDLEWSNLTALVSENGDVVMEVERHMLNSLLDEINGDLTG